MVVFIVVLGLVLDQASKFLALKKLTAFTTLPVINNVFHLTLVRNRGAAFGIFKNYTSVLIIASIFTIIFILFNFKKKAKPDVQLIAFALILSGALGNLIDRLRHGYVIDFLDLRIWPVFNIADSLITVGAILLAISIIKSPPNGGQAKNASAHLHNRPL